jgi:hypothetical protein
MNAFVRVEGQTQQNGLVLADKIKIESIKYKNDGNTSGNDVDSNSSGKDSNQGGGISGGDESDKTRTLENERTKTPRQDDIETTPSVEWTPYKDNPTAGNRQFEIEGIVNSYNGSSIVVSGKSIFIIPETDLRGSPSNGSKVSIHGYINQNGDLIAQSIEVQSTSSSGGGNQTGGGGTEGDHQYDPSGTPGPSKTPDD